MQGRSKQVVWTPDDAAGFKNKLSMQYSFLFSGRSMQDVIDDLIEVLKAAQSISTTDLWWIVDSSLDALTPFLDELTVDQAAVVVRVHRLQIDDACLLLERCWRPWSLLALPSMLIAIEKELLSDSVYLVALLEALSVMIDVNPGIVPVAATLPCGTTLWPMPSPHIGKCIFLEQPQSESEAGLRWGLSLAAVLRSMVERIIDKDTGRVARDPTHSEVGDVCFIVELLEKLNIAYADHYVRLAWTVGLVVYSFNGRSYVDWLVRFGLPASRKDELVIDSGKHIGSHNVCDQDSVEVNAQLRMFRALHRQRLNDLEEKLQKESDAFIKKKKQLHKNGVERFCALVEELGLQAAVSVQAPCERVEVEPRGVLQVQPVCRGAWSS